MTREELQSAIQDFWDEAFHCGKHEISDTSKAIALECMMDAAEHKRTCPSTNADRIRGMSDEEMAEFIQSPFCDRIVGRCGGACHDCTLDWLRQPAEEAQT